MTQKKTKKTTQTQAQTHKKNIRSTQKHPQNIKIQKHTKHTQREHHRKTKKM